MNISRSVVFGCAAAVALLVGRVGLAAPIDPTAPLTVTVAYDDLDLSSSQDAATLYQRLRTAARRVCAPLDGRALDRHSQYRACYQQAVSNAVDKVNRASVTALHERATHTERAS